MGVRISGIWGQGHMQYAKDLQNLEIYSCVGEFRGLESGDCSWRRFETTTGIHQDGVITMMLLLKAIMSAVKNEVWYAPETQVTSGSELCATATKCMCPQLFIIF